MSQNKDAGTSANIADALAERDSEDDPDVARLMRALRTEDPMKS